MIKNDTRKAFGFYEFFAGGGMANIGLGNHWRCLMANDFSEKKARAYKANFAPADEFILNDVRDLATAHLPLDATMAWASFPCQDLSLAGAGLGLQGERSGGAYWGFWHLMQALTVEGRPLPILVLENVVGTITANQGNDFNALLSSLVELGYSVGPLVINAVEFVPQSRPRLFIIAVHHDKKIIPELIQRNPSDLWHTVALRKAYIQASAHIQEAWRWWSLPEPLSRVQNLIDLIEEEPTGIGWHSEAETQRLLDLMAPLHREKVAQVQRQQTRVVGTIYRRIRRDKIGGKAQRAEIRFDNVSGCLRTGSGGSSRQFLMVIEGQRIRSRLLSTREAARLMGLPDSYKLPERYNEAYHLMGDGVVVPVVSWLEQHLLTPLARGSLPDRIKTPEDQHTSYIYKPTQLSLKITEPV